VDKADVAGDHQIGSIGAVKVERIRHAFEVAPRDRAAVEA
jgi:acetyl-CoA carboxylase beta subunit